jgi:hypothetical protein
MGNRLYFKIDTRGMSHSIFIILNIALIAVCGLLYSIFLHFQMKKRIRLHQYSDLGENP